MDADYTRKWVNIACRFTDYACAPELTWAHERRESLLRERKKISEPFGRVLAMDLLEMSPKETVENAAHDLAAEVDKLFSGQHQSDDSQMHLFG